MANLSVSRMKDRMLMAEQIMNLSREGWTIEIDKDLSNSHEIWLRLSGPKGLSLAIDLDGKSNQQKENVFVLSWYFDGPDNDAKLNPLVWTDVNRCYFHKATDVVYSFDDLLSVVELRMNQANDGTAFQ